jgi:hypothetical protein
MRLAKPIRSLQDAMASEFWTSSEGSTGFEAMTENCINREQSEPLFFRDMAERCRRLAGIVDNSARAEELRRLANEFETAAETAELQALSEQMD